MNRHFTTLFWTLLLLLCPAITRADRIGTKQDFDTMVKGGQMTSVKPYTTIVTDFVTYQCSGTDAKMGKDFSPAHTYWSINLPQDNNTYVTTTCINELAEFQIAHYPVSTCTDIKIYVTTDSDSWGDPLTTDNVSYSNGTIVVTVPRNNYYVRIKNTSYTIDVSILEIDWYQDHCNCFIYNPE